MNEADWERLGHAAREAAANAHCPYSRFAVGAAVLTADGAIAAGCNVENASFGLTICAERNAIFRAVADGARAIVAVAIYTPTPTPATPCGACRQVLAEFGRDAIVRSVCDGSAHMQYTLAELLPAAFALPASGSTSGSEQ
jgi:cytidine deaminase